MIVDWFMRNGEVILYLRTRDKDGNLTERYIEKGDPDFVKPFCWIPKSTSNWKLQRLIERYPDARILFDETFVELKEQSKGKYTHDYWNTLYEDVQNHRIHAHNSNETDFKNYIMMRVDRIPNGTKFVEETPELETLMEAENV